MPEAMPLLTRTTPSVDLVLDTNPLGGQTQYGWSSAGFLIATTDPDGSAPSWTRDAAGHVTTISDPMGHATNLTYFANEKPRWKTSPRSLLTSYLYDWDGVLLQLQKPLTTRIFSYDATPKPPRETPASWPPSNQLIPSASSSPWMRPPTCATGTSQKPAQERPTAG